jgi:hypothetical protein
VGDARTIYVYYNAIRYTLQHSQGVFVCLLEISARATPSTRHGDNLEVETGLAPRNDTVSDLNKMLLQLMPGQQHIFKSADLIVDDDGLDIYPTEYLNAIDVSNIPPHELNLKIGAPVILLRNLNPNAGLCNKTRMCVCRCGD